VPYNFLRIYIEIFKRGPYLKIMSKRRSFGSKATIEVPPFLKVHDTKSGLTQEVQVALPLLSTVSRPSFRKVLQAVVQNIKGKTYGEDDYFQLTEATQLEGDTFGKLFTATFAIVRSAIRSRAHKKDILRLVGIGISEEIASDIALVVHSSREDLETAVKESCVSCPSLDNIKWRVDVAISTSALSKCLKPSVLMQMSLSDGSIQNFELPLDKFHNLRCNVAKALRGVHDVESHPLTRVIKHVEDNEKQSLAKD